MIFSSISSANIVCGAAPAACNVFALAAASSAYALGDLPEGADGYVLSAEETYDPPTTALDRNGQGVPYAVYGYGAQIAEVKVGAMKDMGIRWFIQAMHAGGGYYPMPAQDVAINALGAFTPSCATTLMPEMKVHVGSEFVVLVGKVGGQEPHPLPGHGDIDLDGRAVFPSGFLHPEEPV